MMRKLVLALGVAALVAACSEPTVVYVTPAPIEGTGLGGFTIPGASAAPAASQGSGSQTPSGPVSQADMVAATVRIFGYENASDPIDQPLYGGSGTILTKDGYILTNAHVAAPDADGLAVQYGEGEQPPVGKLVIALNVGEDKEPVKTYLATPVAVDGYLDAAVVKVDAMADGSPFDPATLDLPSLPIGDSDDMHIGDSVTIVGFPSIGGSTVTVNKGDVSGFIGDDRLGDRAWIKTSAIVYHGNSGGLAANTNGELIAVPTRLPDFGNGGDVGGYSLLRSVNLVKPLIDAALNGGSYPTSRYVKSGTGQEVMQAVGWLEPADGSCSSADPSRVLPIGVQRLAAGFTYDGFTDGLDYVQAWVLKKDGEWTVLTKRAGLWEYGASGDCFIASLEYADGFPENTYGVVMLAGPDLKEVGNAVTATGAAPPPTPQPTQTTGGSTGTGEEVTVTGRMVDTTTGKPIAGVGFLILQQGLDPNGWVKNPVEEAVIGYGESGKDGTFIVVPPLRLGEDYPVVIAAKGYQPIIGTLTVNGEDLGDVGLTPR